ncbi:MAG TPA: universal stress protein [Gemmatimonadales bacterium]|nr:universal stress protein [Gemmatimonadales bacterium]
MFQTILVTTDFSANSAVAFKPAIEIARKFGARIVLVHAMEGASDPQVAATNLAALAAMTREQLQECGAREIGKAVPWSAEVVFGPPYLAVTDAAAQHHADLIVVATHGRTGLLHLLLGSVAERIARTAACPVLTVRVPA